MRRSGVVVLLALFASALTLRPQVIGVGPLIPEIQEDLGISHAVAGLLGTIPVLCMGLFAVPAPYVLIRLGSRAAIGICLTLVAVFGIARAVVPPAALVIALTVGVGVGIGVLGALMPMVVKERFAHRPAFATGIYALGINVGAGVSAAVAVPLADAAFGWRAPLIAFSVVSALVALAWLAANYGAARKPTVSSARPPRLPWDSPLAWLLAIVFFLTAVVYYGFNAWLVDSYVERGWSEERAAALLAVTILISIPATFGFAYIADRVGSRRLYLTIGSTAGTAGLLGIVLAPGGGWGWAVLVGIWAGSIFTLIMTLPLDVAKSPAEVGAVAAMMLGVGYTLGALSPLALGAIRDATGSFSESLWVLVGACAAVLLLGLLLSPARLDGGVRVSHEPGPAPVRAGVASETRS